MQCMPETHPITRYKGVSLIIPNAKTCEYNHTNNIHLAFIIHSPRSPASQFRFQFQLGRGVGFRDRKHISAPVALAEEDDFNSKVISAATSVSCNYRYSIQREETSYLYRLAYGLGSVNSAHNISRSLPPNAFLTKCVAAFLSSTTNLSSPPFTSHCCCRIGPLCPSPFLNSCFSTGNELAAWLNHDLFGPPAWESSH